MESDIAITEATMRDELLRLPGLAIGGYSETGTLLRFNGGGLWSLADAPKIERFFVQTFGRSLPVTALGPATHDRLRFDHRNAIDVAPIRQRRRAITSSRTTADRDPHHPGCSAGSRHGPIHIDTVHQNGRRCRFPKEANGKAGGLSQTAENPRRIP
jgi:hypothetical protein